MLPESSPSAPPPRFVGPTLRQGRLEEKVARAIVADAPRSAIREAVDQLVMHLRWRQVPVERGVAIVMDVVSQAAATMPSDSRALDASMDCLPLVASWVRVRYARAD